MDPVFRALADDTRRGLLDELFQRDGQTLTELEQRLPMSRFGVMKHLKVLEQAGLVTTRRRGREKLHFLNPVPIRHLRPLGQQIRRAVGDLAQRTEGRPRGRGGAARPRSPRHAR
jgi:DNA-binding transcriptional ArsR family regulator